MSAPFGHVTVPPSRKKRRKYSVSLSGSKTGPTNQGSKSTVFSVPSLNVRRIMYPLPANFSFNEAAMLEAVSVAIHGVKVSQVVGGETAL